MDDKRKPEYAQPTLFPGAELEPPAASPRTVGRQGARPGDRRTIQVPAQPSGDPAAGTQAPSGPYRRRGPGRCPACNQRVDVFPLAASREFIAVVPGEYPARRVPEESAVHVSRGYAWEGRDGSPDTRLLHDSVCPAGPRPEHPELSEMWRRLRIRAVREGVPGFAS